MLFLAVFLGSWEEEEGKFLIHSHSCRYVAFFLLGHGLKIPKLCHVVSFSKTKRGSFLVLLDGWSCGWEKGKEGSRDSRQNWGVGPSKPVGFLRKIGPSVGQLLSESPECKNSILASSVYPTISTQLSQHQHSSYLHSYKAFTSFTSALTNTFTTSFPSMTSVNPPHLQINFLLHLNISIPLKFA